MIRWLIALLFLGMIGSVVALGGLLVAASGVIPIKASSGHWAITEWILQFSKERSVATHALPLEAPPLDDPALVLRGAGHFEIGCRPCHGSPEQPDPRLARAMLPPPPNLAERVRQWKPKELFYLVKHGIKFTGMPAWPSQQRDDEVWAMVAFMQELPGMSPEAYRGLVHGDAGFARAAALSEPLGELAGKPPPPHAVVASCARCHGRDGAGRGAGAIPRLAGQRAEYLRNALAAYARDARQSGTMQLVAASLARAELERISSYYASLAAPEAPAERLDPGAIARGQELARAGVPSDNVPACVECHGPVRTRRNPAFPVIAGQARAYLELQLRLFRQGRRGGSDYAHLMHNAVARLTADQSRDLAAYYASLPWSAD